MAAADVGERVVQYLAALVHHDDVRADLLGLRHHVRREQDGRAPGMLLEDEVAQHARADGVEAAERLVEYQQVGPVDRRRDELDLLRHALRQLVAALGLDARQAHALERGRDPPVEVGAVRALEPRLCGGTRGPSSACTGRALPAGSRCGPSPRAPTGGPRTETSPASGKRIDMTMRMVVVFPAPLGPMNPYSPPRGISRSSLSTAVKAPNVLVTPVMPMAVSMSAGLSAGRPDRVARSASADQPPVLVARHNQIGNDTDCGRCRTRERGRTRRQECHNASLD